VWETGLSVSEVCDRQNCLSRGERRRAVPGSLMIARELPNQRLKLPTHVHFYGMTTPFFCAAQFKRDPLGGVHHASIAAI